MRNRLNTICILYTGPLCLAHPDGSMSKTSKSKLAECIIPDNNNKMNKSLTNTLVHTFLIWWHKSDHVSTMFLKRLNNLFLSSVPKNFWGVDLVVNTYPDVSINFKKRENRNSSSRILPLMNPFVPIAPFLYLQKT